MAQIATLTTSKVVNLLTIGTTMPVFAQNVALEIAERSTAVKYPLIHVYCDKLDNSLREKFRALSGKAHVVVEVRVSQDRLEGIEDQLQLHADDIGQVLNSNRGDWGQGLFYAGGYEVTIAAIRHGGRNFIQVAKVQFEVDFSSN